jgi:lysine biosynthesis protein LysW
MNMAQSKNIGLCPECGEEVRFKKFPYVGQLVTCRRCSAQLEVVRKSPIALRLAEEVWEEEEDFESYEAPRLNQRNKRDW